MIYRSSYLTALLAFLLGEYGFGFAAVPNPGEECWTPTGGLEISSQAQFDEVFFNCSFFDTVVLTNNYTGPFAPQVTSFRGIFSASPYLSNVDLQYCTDLGYMEINTTGVPLNFNIPVASEARDMILIDATPQQPFNFSAPLLNTSMGLNFKGKLSNLSFPLLETVSGDIVVRTGNDMDLNTPITSLPINISFPSLKTISFGIELVGNISGIYFPLWDVTSTWSSDNTILINTTYPLEEITFPSLRSVNSPVTIAGPIKNIYFPALENAENLDFNIDNNTAPFNIHLQNLSDVSEICINGPIGSVDLSSLTNVLIFNVTSTLSLNCTPYDILANSTIVDRWNGQYSCNGNPTTGRVEIKKIKIPLTEDQKLGIGLGSTVGFFVVLCIAVWFWQSNYWIRVRKTKYGRVLVIRKEGKEEDVVRMRRIQGAQTTSLGASGC